MNKSVFFLLLFILFPSFIFSQILVDEKFDNNKYSWLTSTSEQWNSEIKDGFYKIASKSGGWDFLIPLGLDAEKDFFLETKLIVQEGTGSYGVVLKDYRNSKELKEYVFIISPSGSFKIFVWNINPNTIDLIKDWENSSFIQTGLLKENTLSVEKRGTMYTFFINSHKIFNSSKYPFAGAAVGYVLYDNINLQADYLTIRQDRGQINLVPGSESKNIKENLGPKVNSPYEEIVPVISPDGNTILFDVLDDPKNIGNGDIWFCTKNANGEWSERQNIGSPLNNSDNNSVVSVMPDNNTLITAGDYIMENGASRTFAGLSVTHRTISGWSFPEKINIRNMYSNASVLTYCISPDGKVLITAAERNNTYGYTDLYVSFLDSDGSWSEPKNMGSTLNSFGEEATPFIGADGKTLYFSSDGHHGYGRHDIFLSKRLDDSWTNWTIPQNLGPGINSPSWDAYYSVPASGEYAYLVSSENTLGKNDIFRIKLQEEQKPDPVVIIYGNVYDKSNHTPLGASISYHNLVSGKETGIARSNSKDGSYKITLPYGEAYGFFAQKENYLSESESIDLKEKKGFIEIHKDLYLSPIEVGKSITLNNVFFMRSKPELLPESYIELERLVDILKKNPSIKIEISGHTDNIGDSEKNMQLSLERAKTIKSFLVSKNISSNRVKEKGYGGTKPIASNDSEETRKLNRRVEFTILP